MRIGDREGIKKSEVYLIFGTKNWVRGYLSNEAPDYLRDQLEYAKMLKKPFLVLLERGVELPKEIFKDVKYHDIELFNPKNSTQAAEKLTLMLKKFEKYQKENK